MKKNNSILYSLIVKEFYQIVRDPSSILIVFAMPLILLFIFGYGMDLGQGKFSVGTLFEGYQDQNRDLFYSLKGNSYITPISYDNKETMVDAFISGDIKGMLIVQDSFSRSMLNGSQMDIQIITDGTDTNGATLVLNYIMGAFGVWMKNYMAEKGQNTITSLVNLENIVWFNKELNGRNMSLSGSISMILSVIGIILTALVVAREWERGTMEAILTTRATKGQFLLSKYIPYFFLTLFSTVFCSFLCIFVFKVPFKGSYGVLLLTSSLYILCCIGQGFYISTTSKNQFAACTSAAFMGLTPAMMLSGASFPIPSMPKIVQYITYFVPSRYYTPCIQNVFLIQTIWNVILPQCFYMLIYAIVMYILVYRATGDKLE